MAVTVAVAVAVLDEVADAVAVAVGVACVTFTLTGCDAIPLATTTRLLAPASIPAGTSNCVETEVLPVATAIVLWL